MPTYCYLDDGREEEDRRIHEYDDVEEVDDGDVIDRQDFDFQVREAERLFEQQRQQELLNFMIQQQTMNQMNFGF